MTHERYSESKRALEASLRMHHAELDRSLRDLGRTAREGVDPRAIVGRHPYSGLVACAVLGFWIGWR